VIVNIEDVYVLACPVADHSYDARREKALKMAIKKKLLEELEATATADDGKREIQMKVYM